SRRDGDADGAADGRDPADGRGLPSAEAGRRPRRGRPCRAVLRAVPGRDGLRRARRCPRVSAGRPGRESDRVHRRNPQLARRSTPGPGTPGSTRDRCRRGSHPDPGGSGGHGDLRPGRAPATARSHRHRAPARSLLTRHLRCPVVLVIRAPRGHAENAAHRLLADQPLAPTAGRVAKASTALTPVITPSTRNRAGNPPKAAAITEPPHGAGRSAPRPCWIASTTPALPNCRAPSTSCSPVFGTPRPATPAGCWSGCMRTWTPSLTGFGPAGTSSSPVGPCVVTGGCSTCPAKLATPPTPSTSS